MTLLLHPVRLRIVQATSDERAFTVTQLCDRSRTCPRRPCTGRSLCWSRAGWWRSSTNSGSAGAVERSYRLRRADAVITDDEVATMSADDHRRELAAVVGSLLAEFDGYLARDDADPAADGVSYKQFALWLTDEERAELVEEVRASIRARVANRPAPGRARHLLTPIFFPAELSFGDLPGGRTSRGRARP